MNSPSLVTRPSQAGTALLLIDDDPNSLAIVTDYLNSTDFTLLVAEDGESGLKRAVHTLPNLILLDVMMPGMDGFETCRRLKATRETSEIPVIFMTALAAVDQKVRGFEAGAVDFITKPFQREELLARVGVHLRLRELAEKLEEANEQLERRVEERTEELARTNESLKAEIAERHRAEAALKDAARRKDDFLAMLGHELRNPLAPILNAVYLLKQFGPIDPRAVRVRDMIDRQVGNLTRIVDEVLDVTRISRGKTKLHTERVDLAAVLRSCVEDHRPDVDRKGIFVSCRVPAEPLWVVGDRTRLSQIVGNVLDNARKFTPAGGRVDLDLRVNPGDGFATLTVQDTGIGMTRETLARIFEPFVQANDDLARSSGGVGLGLAVVKGLVELHGGTVTASSEGLGRGAQFTARLPVHKGPSEADRSAPESPPLPPQKVLVVEDNPDAAESLRMMLNVMGHSVETASDAPSGLQKAKAFRPSVIICDIGLPGGMDGYHLGREIRADPSLCAVHLIAMTGYGQEQDKQRAKSAGFNLHLTKPVDPGSLVHALASGL